MKTNKTYLQNKKPLGVETPKELSTLDKILSKFIEVYKPCKAADIDFITSQDIFNELQAFYPSESYTIESIVNLLITEGWEPYYDTDAQTYFWLITKKES